MTDVKTLIKQRRRREATVDVCLRGDLAGQYEALARKLKEAEIGNSLAGNPERHRLRDEMERLREEMVAATVPFRLCAMPAPEFQDLWDAHPPRRKGDEVDPRDEAVGFNRSTLFPPLIRACVVEPQLDEEDWEGLLGKDGLSDGQFADLALAALSVNRRPVDVPFSLADSLETTT